MSTFQREPTPQPTQTQPTNPTQPEPIQESERGTKSTRKRARETSNVWTHFTKIEIKSGVFQGASCNYCHKDLAWSNKIGSTTLKNHIGQNRCKKYKVMTSTKSPRSEHVFDQVKSRRDLAIAVAKHNYSFNIVEHEYFHAYVRGLNPYAMVPSRNTLRADVLDVYEEEKTKLYDVFGKLDSKVSFTTDMWTSDHSGKPFCCVTAHYIDEHWKLHKGVIAFQIVPFPHDGETIYTFLRKVIMEWNLSKKVCSVVVDNATANSSMIGMLKEWLVSAKKISFPRDLLHVRCSAHILNLIVQDGLAAIQGFLKTIRKTARFLKKSTFAKQKFDRAKQQTNLNDERELAPDVKHRWNSTFELIETALPLRDAFERFTLIDSSYLKYNPSVQEWEDAALVVECLRTFYEATKLFSGSKYPTSNIFFPIVCSVKLKLIEMENSTHVILRQMCIPMNLKFDKYWDECMSVLTVAVVFDPRCKLRLVEYFFGEIFGVENGAAVHVENVRKVLQDLYISYGGTLATETVSSSSQVVGSRGYLQAYSHWCDAAQTSSVQNELDVYLSEPIHPPQEELDVLQWWKINGGRWPLLQKMARDYLAIPASTVASESAFSLCGRVIDEERSLLGEEAIEALMTLKDWIPPIDKIRRQGMPIIGEEIMEGESEEEDGFED